MSKLHLAFRNFRPELLEATEELFASKPWAMTDDAGLNTDQMCADCSGRGYVHDPDGFGDSEECPTCSGEGVVDSGSTDGAQTKIAKQIAAGQKWLDKACEVYSMPPVVLTCDDWRTTSVYIASPDDNTPATISLSSFKTVVLFRLFAEHRADNSMSRAGRNPDGWAYSLYYTVRPRSFRRLVRERRITAVRVQDLYTAETWERIQAHRLDPSHPNVLSVLARINAGEDVIGRSEVLGADDEAAAAAELSSEADMDRLRALALTDQDEGEDEWEDEAEAIGPEPIEPEDELVEEPEDGDGTEPVSESGHNETDLNAMNRDEVRVLARSLGILNPSSKTKPELVSLILATGTGVTA